MFSSALGAIPLDTTLSAAYLRVQLSERVVAGACGLGESFLCCYHSQHPPVKSIAGTTHTAELLSFGAVYKQHPDVRKTHTTSQRTEKAGKY